jgi:hypothetical protein
MCPRRSGPIGHTAPADSMKRLSTRSNANLSTRSDPALLLRSPPRTIWATSPDGVTLPRRAIYEPPVSAQEIFWSEIREAAVSKNFAPVLVNIYDIRWIFDPVIVMNRRVSRIAVEAQVRFQNEWGAAIEFYSRWTPDPCRSNAAIRCARLYNRVDAKLLLPTAVRKFMLFALIAILRVKEGPDRWRTRQ